MIFRRRRRALDARVQAAADEKDESQRRLDRLRHDIIAPLREAGERNQFAEMIRVSLLEGHRKT